MGRPALARAVVPVGIGLASPAPRPLDRSPSLPLHAVTYLSREDECSKHLCFLLTTWASPPSPRWPHG